MLEDGHNNNTQNITIATTEDNITILSKQHVQGERVPGGMGIQYSRINIKGDMIKYMNNSDSFILN